MFYHSVQISRVFKKSNKHNSIVKKPHSHHQYTNVVRTYNIYKIRFVQIKTSLFIFNYNIKLLTTNLFT